MAGLNDYGLTPVDCSVPADYGDFFITSFHKQQWITPFYIATDSYTSSKEHIKYSRKHRRGKSYFKVVDSIAHSTMKANSNGKSTTKEKVSEVSHYDSDDADNESDTDEENHTENETSDRSDVEDGNETKWDSDSISEKNCADCSDSDSGSQTIDMSSGSEESNCDADESEDDQKVERYKVEDIFITSHTRSSDTHTEEYRPRYAPNPVLWSKYMPKDCNYLYNKQTRPPTTCQKIGKFFRLIKRKFSKRSRQVSMV